MPARGLGWIPAAQIRVAVGMTSPPLRHAVGTGAIDRLLEENLDAALAQIPQGRLLRARCEPVEKMVHGLHEHHTRAAHVEMVEVAVEHREELDESARELDARGAASHDDERQGTLVDQSGLGSCTLELLEHVAAQREGVLQRLEGDGVLLDTRDVEPARLGARCQDEHVIGERGPEVHVHQALVEVDALDRGEPEVDALVVLEDGPDG